MSKTPSTGTRSIWGSSLSFMRTIRSLLSKLWPRMNSLKRTTAEWRSSCRWDGASSSRKELSTRRSFRYVKPSDSWSRRGYVRLSSITLWRRSRKRSKWRCSSRPKSHSVIISKDVSSECSKTSYNGPITKGWEAAAELYNSKETVFSSLVRSSRTRMRSLPLTTFTSSSWQSWTNGKWWRRTRYLRPNLLSEFKSDGGACSSC